jgi:hypothetical protein
MLLSLSCESNRLWLEVDKFLATVRAAQGCPAVACEFATALEVW